MPIDPEALCVELDCCPEGFGVDDIVVSEAILVEAGNCSSTPLCDGVTGIRVTNQGSGYNFLFTTVTIAPPVVGVQATAVAWINLNGSIDFIEITNPGSGYSGIAPLVTITGGSPLNPASAVATIYLPNDSLTDLQTEGYASILS